MKESAGNPNDTIALSVVLCTRNRAPVLGRCLERLDTAAVVAHRGEVLLVDNGSRDGTWKEMEDWVARTGCIARAIMEPAAGLSRARNTGLFHARGDVILFLDDDCYLEEGYIDKLMCRLPGADFAIVGGRARNFDMGESRYGTNKRAEFEKYGPGDFLKTGTFQGTNFAMKRCVYETIGGFDTTLGAGTPFRSEDIDYIARALRAGFRAAHLPELLVFHHHGRQEGEEIRLLENANAIAAGAYYAKFLSWGHWNYLAGWLGTFRMNFKKRFLREIAGAVLFLLRRPDRRRQLLPPSYPGVTGGALPRAVYRYVRMPLFRLRTPRRMVSYCIGTSKSGTHSIWLMLHGGRRAMHELEDNLMVEAALGKADGTLTGPHLERFLRERDRRVWLEMDSSNLNIHFLPELLRLHPGAQFILTVRDAKSWVDSEINHFLAHPFPGHWRAMWDRRYRAGVFYHPAEEEPLARRGLYTLEGYLRYWEEHNRLALDLVPRGQLLVVPTRDITPSIPKIAAFLGMSRNEISEERAHSFAAAKKFGVLDELDPDYVDRKVREFCGPLTDRLFPEPREHTAGGKV